MNNDRIKNIWNNAVKIMEQQNKLSQEEINNAIKAKSTDVIAKFVREKQIGLWSLILLPVIGALQILESGGTMLSIGFTGLLSFIAASIFFVVNKQLNSLNKNTGPKSLKDFLEHKIEVIERYFRFGRKFGPAIGLALMLLSFVIVNKIKTDLIPNSIEFWLVMLAVSVGYYFLVLFINRKQERKYVSPLKHCLEMINTPGYEEKIASPKGNITLILLIIVAIGLILNIILYFLN